MCSQANALSTKFFCANESPCINYRYLGRVAVSLVPIICPWASRYKDEWIGKRSTHTLSELLVVAEEERGSFMGGSRLSQYSDGDKIRIRALFGRIILRASPRS